MANYSKALDRVDYEFWIATFYHLCIFEYKRYSEWLPIYTTDTSTINGQIFPGTHGVPLDSVLGSDMSLQL